MDNRFARPVGFLAVFAASPVIDAGLRALIPLIYSGDWLRTLTTTIAICASMLFLIAGVLLCAKQGIGRQIANWSTAIAVPTYIVAACIHMVGAHALLYGVGYPIAIVTLLHRATPSSGIPAGGENTQNVVHSGLRADKKCVGLEVAL